MFALFAEDGTCVATLDAALCPIVLDGERRDIGAVRAVAVREDWRGRGLFRALMTWALHWTDGPDQRATLLFTAEPALYRAFGFATQAQHAVVGAAGPAEHGPLARPLDLSIGSDVAIVRKLYDMRAPLSDHCALEIDWPQFAANLRSDPALELAFCADLDAVVVYERADEDQTRIVDVVARRMPTMAQILGRIGTPTRRVVTLFPPDRLDWNGTPEAEDTGLMIRGALPPAMAREFMLPPTVEF